MFQSPRGTRDILPEEASVWRYVEGRAIREALRFGYGEIRTPTFEESGVFLRGVGAGTDIVDKEIYRFLDKGGTDLALRPEATASVVRAYLQHGMASQPQPVKLFSIVSVYRYDRPQAGRYREFRQFNLEAIGDADPLVDAEVIAVLWRFLEGLGLRNLTILLNSIGEGDARKDFIRALVAYYEPHKESLCGDCRRRLETNPLRLLDCKVPQCQEYISRAPRTIDFLSAESDRHFGLLRRYLEAMDMPYSITPTLVRGLDYYTRTVFEVVPPGIGAQSTIGGGGRYDGLAEQLDGRPTPGVGFAAGLDRIILNLREQNCPLPAYETPQVFFAALGEAAKAKSVALADSARRLGLDVVVGTGDRGMKARMRQASSSGARWTVIVGEDELRDSEAVIRDMGGGDQKRVAFESLASTLASMVEVAR